MECRGGYDTGFHENLNLLDFMKSARFHMNPPECVNMSFWVITKYRSFFRKTNHNNFTDIIIPLVVGHYSNDVGYNSEAHECERVCAENGKPMTCKYHFYLEWYVTMSKVGIQ